MRRGWLRRRAGVLAVPDFRRFYAGYVTSLFGSSMSTVAIAWAVLDSGASATGLGYVFTAAVVPQVLLLAVFAGRPARWVFVLLASLEGTGEAFFAPVPHLAAGGHRAVRLLQPDHLGTVDAARAGHGPRLPRRRGGVGRDHGGAGRGRDRGRGALARPLPAAAGGSRDHRHVLLRTCIQKDEPVSACAPLPGARRRPLAAPPP